MNMVIESLIRRYNRLNKWVEELSRARYALLMGCSSFTGRMVFEFFHGEQPLWRSAVDAGASALGIAGFYYICDPRRPEFPTLYRRLTEGAWRGPTEEIS
jgi:hypothetical protein